MALEIALEGRVFGAQEARDKGLVNRVVPDDKVEEESLRARPGASPKARRWSRAGTSGSSAGCSTLDPLSPEENDESYACFDTEDFRIGYRAFLAKKKPRFRGK